jgi:hypothetical protein
MIGHGVIFIIWTMIAVWLAAIGGHPIGIAGNAGIAAVNLLLCLLALRRDLAR